jgi:ubiquinone/menaquinone biosynthesis C-methylase UbiE
VAASTLENRPSAGVFESRCAFTACSRSRLRAVKSDESVRRFGQVFDQAAEAYDSVRPGYPDSLVDLAIRRGGLDPGSRVLEVGSGTGKLTELLVRRQLNVDAVEPGSNMIAAARKRLGGTDAVTFHVGRFEDVDLPESTFDAVFSATAFHWVDPEVGWAKAASHLNPGGLLALLSHLILRDDQSAAVQDELRAVLFKHAPDVAAGWHPPRELDAVLAGVPGRRGNASDMWDWLISAGQHRVAVPGAAGLFIDVRVDTEVREVEETADELIAHYRTTSLYHRIDPARRDALERDDRRVVERHGGTIRWSLAVVLMTARRAPAP